MLLERFHALDSLLADHADFWQLKPFHLREYPAHWPQALTDWLETRSDAWLADHPAGQVTLPANVPLPAPEVLSALVAIPERHQPQVPANRFLHQHIPGRKWQQILHFAGAIPMPAGPVLEWCAGKGHLGRLLGYEAGVPVASLEWDEALCRDGRELAAKAGVDQQFHCADALSHEAAQWLAGKACCVALHACGELHLQLMRHWSGRGQLSIAPCCYHLSASARTMSQVAQSARVQLQAGDLHLPLQETVTAGAGVRRLREREVHWRLAFDEWQRSDRGVDVYLPLPNVRKSQLNQSPEAFFQWAAERKALSLPAGFSVAEWLAAGERRLQRVRRMEWVSHWFRRALELWLILDRALYLQEKGAAVELVSFCAPSLTPRNVLIIARGESSKGELSGG